MKRDYLKVIALFLLFIAVLYFAVNPKAEERKVMDIETRKDARTLLAAFESYKEIYDLYPWETEFYTDRKLEWIPMNQEWKDQNEEIILDKMIDKEGKILRQNFANTISSPDYNTLRLYSLDYVSNEIYLCFNPQSLVFNQEARFRCEGNPPSDYPPQACDDFDAVWYCTP